MWNHVNLGRFSYFEPPPRYYSYDPYKQIRSHSVYGQNYSYRPYYDYSYRPMHYYHPYYSSSDVCYGHPYRQSYVPQSYNFLKSANNCYKDSWKEKHTTGQESLKSRTSISTDVNSKADKSSPNSGHSQHVRGTNLQDSSRSIKMNNQENANLDATENWSRNVTKSNPHILNGDISDDHFRKKHVNKMPEKILTPVHEMGRNTSKDVSSCKAESREENYERVTCTSEKDSSSANLRHHYKENITKAKDSCVRTASKALNHSGKDLKDANTLLLSSNSDASPGHLSTVSLVSNSMKVKSELLDDRNFITKTEEFFDYDCSNLKSVSANDCVVKDENPADPGYSVGDDLYGGKRMGCKTEPGDSLPLDASTSKKILSDVVHMQLVELTSTDSLKIEKKICVSKEFHYKTENMNRDYKSCDQHHTLPNVSLSEDVQSSCSNATIEYPGATENPKAHRRLSEKSDVKSDVKQKHTPQTLRNQRLEWKDVSVGVKSKCAVNTPEVDKPNHLDTKTFRNKTIAGKCDMQPLKVQNS